MAESLRPHQNRDQKAGNRPTLIPPDATAGEKKKPSRALPLLILGCGLLLIVAALLVLLLPLQQNTPLNAHQARRQEVPPVVGQSSQQQGSSTEETVREIDLLMEGWLRKQAEAEAMNIAAWGGDRYNEATALARECDRLLGEQQNLAAKQACERAIDGLGALMASRGALLDQALESGWSAIEQGTPDAAASHFQLALAIDADDERAQKGARRAGQLPAVLAFLQDGLAMEKAGDSEGALLALSEALVLDPDFGPTQQALIRVKGEIAGQEFQQAMSRALQAMADGKLPAARTALQKAEAIRPGDLAVHDLKQQLARTQIADRLTSLRQDAERLEQQERWADALDACQQALALDSHAAFAASCKERVSMRIELDGRLKGLLAKPERLFDDGPLKEARQMLAQASQATPRGPLLASQIGQLETLITQAEAETEVVIRSDGLTEVVVYHVGRLGVFLEKTLVLRTGDYTVTGSRKGFRDVRQTLKVRPEAGKMVFTLRCEEPI